MVILGNRLILDLLAADDYSFGSSLVMKISWQNWDGKDWSGSVTR